MKKSEAHEEKRIERKADISTYIDRLQYAINSGNAKVQFQKDRKVDERRDKKYTNRYTMLTLFPDEDEVEVMKRELEQLTVEDYIETVKDKRYPKRSEMTVFGKKYSDEDVYIKIRVEILDAIAAGGDNHIFVMSFHFAEEKFVDDDFPYRKKQG
ncbi:hypothetical protein MFMK1_000784 [Metallumcola ferriviriculae]|uniref:Uncharacterized protein n=1 Tax=Metallumcola ferriviriculae TaxID=3039180 RepID=A0AAU0UI40_9FIRM|nr:hypothetical protein MFMK1_000784 [Desulfitibacteraceae bacterium MK1]